MRGGRTKLSLRITTAELLYKLAAEEISWGLTKHHRSYQLTWTFRVTYSKSRFIIYFLAVFVVCLYIGMTLTKSDLLSNYGNAGAMCLTFKESGGCFILGRNGKVGGGEPFMWVVDAKLGHQK